MVKISVCQFTAGIDVEANLKSCLDLLTSSAEAGADLLVLPEAAMVFDPQKEKAGTPLGQPVDGPFMTRLSQAAKEHGVAVVVGITERLDGDARDSNTLVAISKTGERLGVYRKIHLYDAFGYRESETVRPGDITEPLVFDLDGTKIGALTCYDLRFPEAFRWVVDAGADVIALPAAWAVGPMKEEHWNTLLRARAIENTVYLAAAGQTGPVSCGQSAIIDPMGVTVVSAGEQPGNYAIGAVSPERLAAVRMVNPSLGNRRFTVAPK